MCHFPRYDRDGFIDIKWENVLRGADDQFERYSHHLIDQLNEPYDYGKPWYNWLQAKSTEFRFFRVHNALRGIRI